MKPKEIRELSIEEIRQRLLDEEQELQNKRFQHAVAGLENPTTELRLRRRNIARLKTILKERETPA